MGALSTTSGVVRLGEESPRPFIPLPNGRGDPHGRDRCPGCCRPCRGGAARGREGRSDGVAPTGRVGALRHLLGRTRPGHGERAGVRRFHSEADRGQAEVITRTGQGQGRPGGAQAGGVDGRRAGWAFPRRRQDGVTCQGRLSRGAPLAQRRLPLLVPPARQRRGDSRR